MPSLLIQSGVRVLLTITLALQYSDGFRTDGGNEFIGPSSSTRAETQISSSIAPYDAFAKDDAPSTTMTVNFVGEAAMSSEVAAVDESKSLNDFFAMHPHIILQGANNNHINEHININDDLFTRYKQVCHKLGASSPTPNDSRLFDVTTSGLKFPGLTVQSIATIGVKTITSEQHPCYEIVVVKDKTQLKGRFSSNKVTSPGNNEQTTTSVNRISVVPREDGMIAFVSNAALSLCVQFPSFLSASKNSLEKTGCASIQKVRGRFFLVSLFIRYTDTYDTLLIQKILEEDVSASLKKFHAEYVRWLVNGPSPRKRKMGRRVNPLKKISRLGGAANAAKKMIYSWFF